MSVVARVTAAALLRRVAERGAVGVAVAADGRAMRARQWKVRMHVLEERDVESHDVRVAALVLAWHV